MRQGSDLLFCRAGGQGETSKPSVSSRAFLSLFFSLLQAAIVSSCDLVESLSSAAFSASLIGGYSSLDLRSNALYQRSRLLSLFFSFTFTRTHVRTHPQTHLRAHRYALSLAHTHTHTDTHTHTHTHTHTQSTRKRRRKCTQQPPKVTAGNAHQNLILRRKRTSQGVNKYCHFWRYNTHTHTQKKKEKKKERKKKRRVAEGKELRSRRKRATLEGSNLFANR